MDRRRPLRREPGLPDARGADYRLDTERLAASITPRTKAIALNTPNNPMGRVFDRGELQGVADLCLEHDLIAITDEIYEHILYRGEHIPLATLPGMAERTVTVSGLSKTFSITGWRVGTIVAPPDLTDAIRKVHDFLTVGHPPRSRRPVRSGSTARAGLLRVSVRRIRRAGQLLLSALRDAGFRCAMPEGAYYILADFSGLSDEDDTTFAKRLAREAGVASVPGSSFFSTPEGGRSLVRFAFCKKHETLREARERLRKFAADVAPNVAPGNA